MIAMNRPAARVATEPVIRRAHPGDAMPLSALAERTFRDTFAAYNAPDDMDAHCRGNYARDLMAREIAAPHIVTLVAEHDGQLTGYGQLRWTAVPACVHGARPAEIGRLYVDAPWHGLGIAQALMARMVDHAIAGGADRLWLGVWESNHRALAFYRKIGFVEVGRHVFMVGPDPQNDLLLARDAAPLAISSSP